MNRVALAVAVIILTGMFAFSTYAGYAGLGAVTSTTNSTHTTNSSSGMRSIFFPVFIGGGPGSGK